MPGAGSSPYIGGGGVTPSSRGGAPPSVTFSLVPGLQTTISPPVTATRPPLDRVHLSNWSPYLVNVLVEGQTSGYLLPWTADVFTYDGGQVILTPSLINVGGGALLQGVDNAEPGFGFGLYLSDRDPQPLTGSLSPDIDGGALLMNTIVNAHPSAQITLTSEQIGTAPYVVITAHGVNQFAWLAQANSPGAITVWERTVSMGKESTPTIIIPNFGGDIFVTFTDQTPGGTGTNVEVRAMTAGRLPHSSIAELLIPGPYELNNVSGVALNSGTTFDIVQATYDHELCSIYGVVSRTQAYSLEIDWWVSSGSVITQVVLNSVNGIREFQVPAMSPTFTVRIKDTSGSNGTFSAIVRGDKQNVPLDNTHVLYSPSPDGAGHGLGPITIPYDLPGIAVVTAAADNTNGAWVEIYSAAAATGTAYLTHLMVAVPATAGLVSVGFEIGIGAVGSELSASLGPAFEVFPATNFTQTFIFLYPLISPVGVRLAIRSWKNNAGGGAVTPRIRIIIQNPLNVV